MLTLHWTGDALSIGMLDPHPPAELTVYDFGSGELRVVDPDDVLAVADTDPARTSFAPDLSAELCATRLAANDVVRLPRRRKRTDVPTSFVSGYDVYARERALYWRKRGAGTQPLLAAGVFSLSSIQTNIVTALKLFELLTPWVLEDEVPPKRELESIVRASGAGFVTKRPRWYLAYADYRFKVAAAMDLGLRDDALRRAMSVQTPVPIGLGLAKLSFTLALVGNDLGCLDARILAWALTPHTRKKFESAISKKREGTYSEAVYRIYRQAELRILADDSPFYDPTDPVALARSQWMLWESLGPESARTHTHEELFEAVVDGRLDAL